MKTKIAPQPEIIVHRESLFGWELTVALLHNLGLYEWRVTPPGLTSTRANAHVYGAEWQDAAAVAIGKNHLRETANAFVPVNLGGDT